MANHGEVSPWVLRHRLAGEAEETNASGHSTFKMSWWVLSIVLVPVGGVTAREPKVPLHIFQVRISLGRLQQGQKSAF